ncbi:MAG: glutamate--tRNA ligase [Methanobacteriota archaeon]|nr:MAG: glutamate--tRNA ligase [Euryarchaeota archaeon]
MNVEAVVRKYALQNAVFYGGKATIGAVMGKVMAENPDLRPRAKEISTLAESIVAEVNAMPSEAQRKSLQENAPDLLVRETKPKEFSLPDLAAVEGPVRMRIAPNPSGPLHVGHSRMAILNDEYVKRYGGKCINRFEDTDPARIDPSGYDSILADLDWLDVKISETVIQSDRFELYYGAAKRLLEIGKAYICTCQPDFWRDLKAKKKPCPHREEPISEQNARWDLMFDGGFGQEEASLIVKTDLSHPNPAIRDFVALRIDETPHPRTGTRYRVYPLMNLAVAVDDHELELTHVLRGKDHLNNTYRQLYIYDYMGWDKPTYVHYGRVSMGEIQLSTSKMSAGITEGLYAGWDDPQLGTLSALRRRGIRPESIRRYWIEAGVKEVDIEFSWKTLYAFNKEVVDDSAGRFFFVDEPMRMPLKAPSALTANAPVHPAHPERGTRQLEVPAGGAVYLSRSDVPENGERLRLKDLCNIVFRDGALEFEGNDLSVLREGVRIVHWVPEDSVEAEVKMTDGSTKTGLAERGIASAKGEVIQLERFGFVRVEETSPRIRCIYAHR